MLTSPWKATTVCSLIQVLYVTTSLRYLVIFILCYFTLQLINISEGNLTAGVVC